MYKLYEDEVGWQGVLYGIQGKSATTLHAGAKTALSLKGYGHYLNFREGKVFLFSDMNENSNIWLGKNPQLVLKRTEVFDYDKPDYLTSYNTGTFEIKIASPELAAFEMLYLTPQEESFDEAEKIMEGLTTLRPRLVQSLLEECKSIKVKRLFLFLSEKHEHNWLKELQLENINLGSGKRVVVKNGILNKKYNINPFVFAHRYLFKPLALRNMSNPRSRDEEIDLLATLTETDSFSAEETGAWLADDFARGEVLAQDGTLQD